MVPNAENIPSFQASAIDAEAVRELEEAFEREARLVARKIFLSPEEIRAQKTAIEVKTILAAEYPANSPTPEERAKRRLQVRMLLARSMREEG